MTHRETQALQAALATSQGQQVLLDALVGGVRLTRGAASGVVDNSESLTTDMGKKSNDKKRKKEEDAEEQQQKAKVAKPLKEKKNVDEVKDKKEKDKKKQDEVRASMEKQVKEKKKKAPKLDKSEPMIEEKEKDEKEQEEAGSSLAKPVKLKVKAKKKKSLKSDEPEQMVKEKKKEKKQPEEGPSKEKPVKEKEKVKKKNKSPKSDKADITVKDKKKEKATKMQDEVGSSTEKPVKEKEKVKKKNESPKSDKADVMVKDKKKEKATKKQDEAGSSTEKPVKEKEKVKKKNESPKSDKADLMVKDKKKEKATKKQDETGSSTEKPVKEKEKVKKNESMNESMNDAGPSTSLLPFFIPAIRRPPTKSKTGKVGPKALLPKHQQKKFIESEKKRENIEVEVAIRRSKVDKKKKDHTGEVSSSLDEEEDSDDNRKMRAKARLMKPKPLKIINTEKDMRKKSESEVDEEGYEEEEDDDDVEDPVFVPDPPGEINIDDDEVSWMSEGSSVFSGLFSAEGDVSEGDQDAADEGEEDVAKVKKVKKPKKPKKKKYREPASDNDPSKAPDDDDAGDEDIHGWTRTLRKVPKRAFQGPTPAGPTFPRTLRPLDIFLQFFPLFLFTWIAKWTNKQIDILKKKAQKTTTAEIRAWFGIQIVMGLVKTNNRRNYWSPKPGFRNILISQTMTKGRYDEISRFIQCTDPTTNPESWDASNTEKKKHKFCHFRAHPMFPLQEVWDTVLDNCRLKYNCRQDLAIDEAMIKYKGAKGWAKRFFMPFKPIRSGFKVYAMADSKTGYLCNFKIHQMASRPQKMLDIAMDVASTHLGMRHHIYTDKAYTSVDLARQLLREKTHLTGAIRMRSKQLPIELSQIQKNKQPRVEHITKMGQTKRGTIYSRQNGRHLTYTLWKDSSVVSILSTGHDGFRNKDTDFLTRHYSEDGTAKSKEQQVKAPPAAISYTQCMGGVDRADQFRAYHTCARKSQKWWKQLLYFLVDVSRVNAWLCYKHFTNKADDEDDDDDDDSDDDEDDDDRDDSTFTHCDFTMELAEQLINGYAHGGIWRQAKPDRVPVHNGPLHQLVRMDSVYPKICRQCQISKTTTPKNRQVKSRFGCEACGVHLCRKDCFTRFHAAFGIDPSTAPLESADPPVPISISADIMAAALLKVMATLKGEEDATESPETSVLATVLAKAMASVSAPSSEPPPEDDDDVDSSSSESD
ncbi:uncharacterized protein [Amphiura filiformis]|uniref:uncharacterized protein n=1 Tax=Amphiura filiformis TaxID=82378 RepID=UPI003B2161A6